MLFKELDDKELVKLLEDASKKLASTVERDSKILTEMNIALNWIITLMTVLLAASINFFKDTAHCSIDYHLLYISKGVFGACIIGLLIHKITLIEYEKVKYQFLNTLSTHELELKYDIKLLRSKINTDEKIFIPEFINNFRNGKFIPYPGLDERPKGFVLMDKKLKIKGKLIKGTFFLSIMLFLTNFLIIMYLFLK